MTRVAAMLDVKLRVTIHPGRVTGSIATGSGHGSSCYVPVLQLLTQNILITSKNADDHVCVVDPDTYCYCG